MLIAGVPWQCGPNAWLGSGTTRSPRSSSQVRLLQSRAQSQPLSTEILSRCVKLWATMMSTSRRICHLISMTWWWSSFSLARLMQKFYQVYWQRGRISDQLSSVSCSLKIRTAWSLRIFCRWAHQISRRSCKSCTCNCVSSRLLGGPTWQSWKPMKTLQARTSASEHFSGSLQSSQCSQSGVHGHGCLRMEFAQSGAACFKDHERGSAHQSTVIPRWWFMSANVWRRWSHGRRESRERCAKHWQALRGAGKPPQWSLR